MCLSDAKEMSLYVAMVSFRKSFSPLYKNNIIEFFLRLHSQTTKRSKRHNKTTDAIRKIVLTIISSFFISSCAYKVRFTQGEITVGSQIFFIWICSGRGEFGAFSGKLCFSKKLFFSGKNRQKMRCPKNHRTMIVPGKTV